METKCPHCSRTLEVDHETLVALKTLKVFDCPSCGKKIATALLPEPAEVESTESVDPLAPNESNEFVASTEVEPLPVEESSSPPLEPSPSAAVEASPSAPPRSRAAATAGRRSLVEAFKGMNRNIRILGAAVLLLLGGLVIFIATRRTGDTVVKRQKVLDKHISNEFFTRLIASGATNADALIEVEDIHENASTFVGVSREKLSWVQARELANRTGAEILDLAVAAKESRKVLANWLVGLYPQHQGRTVWVRDNGVAKVMDCPDVLSANDREQPRHVFLYWPRTETWANRGWSWMIQPQFDEVTPFSAWGLARIRIGKLWGVVDEAGKVLQPPAFDLIEPFAEQGSARVSQGGKWGLVDRSGKLIAKPEWEDVQHFINGFIPVKKDGKWGYLDTAGQLAIPCVWGDAWRFSPEGFAVITRLGKRGVIDRTGKTVIEPIWDGVFNFTKEGVGMVRRNWVWGLIDVSGRLLCEPKWRTEWLKRRFDLGFLPVQDGARKLLLGTDGNALIGTEYDSLFTSRSSVLLARKPNERILVGPHGKVIVKMEGTLGSYGADGLALLTSNGKTGFIDRDGDSVVPLRSGKMRLFSEGLAAAERDGRWGFLGRSGEMVIKPEWDEVKDFSDGMAGVRREGKWGFIERSGKLVLKSEWDDVRDFRQGRAAVRRGDKWGFVDQSGKVIAEPKWSAVGDFSEGFAAVSIEPTQSPKEAPGSPRSKRRVNDLRSIPGWTFVDRTGEPAFGPRFWSMNLVWDGSGRFRPSSAPRFIDGHVRFVGMMEGRSQLLQIDTRGIATPFNSRVQTMPPGFSITRPYYRGRYHSRRGSSDDWTLLHDAEGAVVMPDVNPAYDLVSDFIPYATPPKYGLIDATGRIVAEPAWDEARILSPDLVWIRVGAKCGLADKTGKVIIAPKWDELDVLPVDSGSLGDDGKSLMLGRRGKAILSPWVRVKDGGKIKILRLNGEPAIPDSLPDAAYVDFYGSAHVVFKQPDGQGGFVWSIYESATGDRVPFPDASTFRWNWNMADKSVIWMKDKATKEWRLMGRKGHDLGHRQPEVEKPDGWGFVEGRGVLHKPDGWCYVDTEIKPIAPDKWEEARDFSEGHAAVRRDGKWGFIGLNGATVIPTVYDRVLDFSRGLAAVQKEGRWGYIDPQGKIAIEPVWDEAESFAKWIGEPAPDNSEVSIDVAEVEINGAAALIDRNGALIVDPAQKRIARNGAAVANGKEELVVMRRGESVGIVKRAWDRRGTLEATPARAWKEGNASTNDSTASMLIDETGKPLTEAKWNSPWYDRKADPLAGGLLSARTTDQKYGLIRKDGTTVVEPRFDRIAWIAPKIAAVWNRDEGGLIDATGKWIFRDNDKVRIARFGLKNSRSTEAQHQHGLALIEDVPKWGYARLNR